MSPSKKKKIIILIAIALILVIFKIVTNKTPKENVEEYIETIGFKENKNTGFYEKQTSDLNIESFYKSVDKLTPAEYSALYFDTKNYTLLKDSMTYSNEITSIFNATYDYKAEIMTYVYEVSKGNTVVMLEGDYNHKEDIFNCSVTHYDNIKLFENGNETIICDKVQYDVEIYQEEIRNLITNPNILNKMKENK